MGSLRGPFPPGSGAVIGWTVRAEVASSVEMWSNLVSEHIFVHVFHHRPPRKYGFFCLLCEFSVERFHAHVITSSSAIHSTPQPPSQLRNCLPPPSTEAGIKFRKIHGCHVAMHLIFCHRRPRTSVCQFFLFS